MQRACGGGVVPTHVPVFLSRCSSQLPPVRTRGGVGGCALEHFPVDLFAAAPRDLQDAPFFRDRTVRVLEITFRVVVIEPGNLVAPRVFEAPGRFDVLGVQGGELFEEGAHSPRVLGHRAVREERYYRCAGGRGGGGIHS